MQVSRRSLLIGSSLAAAPISAWARTLSRGQFTHGTASGDPLTNRVVLWTRFVPETGSASITWEISEDETFARVARRGSLSPNAANNFCAKVDVSGLRPGRSYFYRFLSASGPSATGRTRTAPEGAVDTLNMAFFSCANKGFGFFHAYADAAADERIELCLHLGDYIYEIERGAYPNPDEMVPGRDIEPATETRTLADYRARYASYHTDRDLLEIRRLKPFSTIWDDHEFADNTWLGGSWAHNPNTEGTWSDRVSAATRSYFEWMPIRLPEPRTQRIFRTLDWGDLARIVLLDTRYFGRDRQPDNRQLIQRIMQAGANGPDLAAEFRRTTLDVEHRSLMGARQEQWFAEQLEASKRRGQPWQIVAQQLLVGDWFMAPAMLDLLPAGMTPQQRQWPESSSRLGSLGLDWNLDGWGGYTAARRRTLDACVAHANNAIFLGGDTHNCWLNNLPATAGNRLAAIEFGGGSISSPGFERTFSNAQPGQREAAMRSANPNLAFCDIANRGYGVLHLSHNACNAEWRTVSSVRTSERGATQTTRFASAPSTTAGPSAWSLT